MLTHDNLLQAIPQALSGMAGTDSPRCGSMRTPATARKSYAIILDGMLANQGVNE